MREVRGGEGRSAHGGVAPAVPTLGGHMAIGWKVVYDGKTPPPGEVVRPDERLSWSRTAGIGAQHVVAMFGATFVFPIVMGLDPNTAIMMSGIATIMFLLITQNKVPSYLGTSASFVGGVVAIRAAGGDSSLVTGSIMIAGLVLAAMRRLDQPCSACRSSTRCSRRRSPAAS